MKVRILSGNLAGTIQDLPQLDAEVAIQTGYAEAVPEDSMGVGEPPVTAEEVQAP